MPELTTEEQALLELLLDQAHDIATELDAKLNQIERLRGGYLLHNNLAKVIDVARFAASRPKGKPQ